ncbi:MAG: hypothetical protein LUI13_10735 [Lachnospiraceae bacterium]|nr:hypothetical protein [Lachnospiraceae bacterium]
MAKTVSEAFDPDDLSMFVMDGESVVVDESADEESSDEASDADAEITDSDTTEEDVSEEDADSDTVEEDASSEDTDNVEEEAETEEILTSDLAVPYSVSSSSASIRKLTGRNPSLHEIIAEFLFFIHPL